MPYRLHEEDKSGLKFKLADLLEVIPRDELPGLIEGVDRLFQDREFGWKDVFRNSNPHDPYWFEHRLIVDADKYIAEGKPRLAHMYCLREHNHSHSGFVGQARRVYHRPSNEVEQQLSEQIRQMIVRVTTAMLDSDPLSEKRFGPFGDSWFSVIAINDCLKLLGANVPQDLIDRFKKLLAKYGELDKKNDEYSGLKREFERRFGV